MRNFLFIGILIVFSYSCASKKIAYNPIVEEEVFANSDTVVDAVKLLSNNLDKLKMYPDSIFYLRSNFYIDCSENPSLLVAGRFIGDGKFYGIDYSCKESLLIFYRLDENIWNIVGKEGANDFHSIEFEDLDDDKRNEIITSTFPNMNGNSFKEVYYYSQKSDTIKYAGGFSSHYRVNLLKRRIEVEYYGSWYANQSKTIYEWHDEKLIPIKEVVLGLKKSDMKHDSQFISYYENPTRDKDTLVLKFKKTYREKNKKLYNLWENFFNQ